MRHKICNPVHAPHKGPYSNTPLEPYVQAGSRAILFLDQFRERHLKARLIPPRNETAGDVDRME